MTRRTSRPGLTLTEALVSLFVMALGLLSLLTLFPLGAMQMGQALKDDRSAQTAMQADGYMRMYWQTHVVEGTAEDEGLLKAFSNPNSPPTAAPSVSMPTTMAPHTPLTDANSAEWSYPVLVDPLGWEARAAMLSERTWVGLSSATSDTQLMPRRSLEKIRTNPLAQQLSIKTCSLADDVTFYENGTPTGPSGAVDWGAKYNWAAVVQRPRNGQRNVANLTVLVFDGRPLLFAATRTELVLNASSPTTVTSTAPVSTVTFTLPTGYDPTVNYVRKGGWIMDGAISGTTRVANFYRIVGVNPTGAGAFTVDLETPLRTPAASHTPKFYIFAGLAEVFERPQLRPTSETP